jgi:hypothetical protein
MVLLVGYGLLGALVLAGWVALPWGHLGPGPTPPSLLVLINHPHLVDMEFLNTVIDNLFDLHAAAPAQLRQGGELRPAIEIAYACLLMHYADRKDVGEVRDVLVRMEETLYEEARKAGHNIQGSASDLLKAWGNDIKTQFESDNVRLTLPHHQPANALTQV